MEEKKLKISFDFDGTLTNPVMQKLAKTLVDSDSDVWIVTARMDKTFFESVGGTTYHLNINSSVNHIADIVGIPRNKIIYTNGELKSDVYFKEQFDIHFDDMVYEVDEINEKGGNAILVGMILNKKMKTLY